MKGLRKYLTPFAPDLMNQDGSQGKVLFSVPG